MRGPYPGVETDRNRFPKAIELGHREVEADLKSLDLAEPAVGAGLTTGNL
jgi:hypothetical protein